MTCKAVATSVCLAMFLLACPGPNDQVDAGDEGRADAGPSDTQRPDAGPPTLRFVADGGEVTSIFLADQVAVQLTGLSPKSQVLIEAEMSPWTSRASFEVADDGSVDTSRDAPISGSYTGVDVDGLFWSMDSERLVSVQSTDVTFKVLVDGEPTLSSKLTRRFDVIGIRQVAVQGANLVGVLVVPPGPGPFPAIIAFGGSEGGLSGGFSYASDLVLDGYVVLALAYFDEQQSSRDVPSALANVPLEYFDRALAWLKQRPEVDAQRLGVIGGSRGGELALLLAARIPELRAVVADAPSGYVWGGLTGQPHAWTSANMGLSAVPPSGRAPDFVTTKLGNAYVLTPVFADSVAKATPMQLEAARIQVENAGAAIAMFAGADDQLWPACDLAKVAYDKLVASGHAMAKGDVFNCYPGAGHLLSGVGLPSTWTSASTLTTGEILALGGTPQGTAKAARARLTQLRAFLSRTMGGSN